MTIYLLSPEFMGFPDPAQASEDGLLAVGGDLSVQRLVAAYSRGIYPWYDVSSPILWWSPDPRLVLEPRALHIPRSLAKVIRKEKFKVTLDTAFERVIQACARSGRANGPGTWLVPDMVSAYVALHEAGCAHSVEAWDGDVLAGGLYGVGLGRVFFGESMFFEVSDASKVAFAYLVRLLEAWDFEMIDCQQTTGHLRRFGACEIARSEFLDRLKSALESEDRLGKWSLPQGFSPL